MSDAGRPETGPAAGGCHGPHGHPLHASALAALVLVSTFASGPASGGMRMQHMHDDLMSGLKGIKKPKAHEGFATQKGPQAPYIHPVDPEGSTRLKINTPMGE